MEGQGTSGLYVTMQSFSDVRGGHVAKEEASHHWLQ